MSEKKETISMTLKELLDDGLQCYQNGNFKGAAFCFENYLLQDKKNADVLHVLAQIWCELECYTKAVATAILAFELEPENKEFMFTLAESFFFVNDYVKAEPLYNQLKVDYPLNTHILDRLISIYNKQGKRLTVIRTKALKREVEDKIDPFQMEIAKSVATAKSMIESGATMEARLLLEAVVKLADDNYHGNGLLAMMSLDEKKYDEALVYFDKIKNSMLDGYFGSYAYVLEKTKGKEAALPVLLDGVKLTPNNQELRKQLAILYFNLKKYYSAHKEINQITEESIKDRQYFIIKAVSRFLSIEEKEKWINLEVLSSAADELKSIHKKYPDDEQISFHLVKYYLNIGDITQAYDLLCKSEFSDLKNKEWNKHPYYLAIRDKKSFFKSYLCGHEQRLRLPLASLEDRVWKGESLKNKKVVIMREQGIGDELIFAHNYNWIINQTADVSIFTSERLKNEFSRVFPKALFYSVIEKNGTLIYPAETQSVIFNAEVIIFAGDTSAYCYNEHFRPLYDESFYKIAPDKKAYWHQRLNSMVSDIKRPKVGLIWRSGAIDGLRSSHYLSNKEIAKVVSAIPEVDFFNCMYVDCKKELNSIRKDTGIKIHHFSDLDQKNDFENTAAMLSCLDLLVGAYTATTSLAVAVGTGLVAYAADYLKEDDRIEKEPFYYCNTSHISLPISDKNRRVCAIEAIISATRKKLNL